MAVYLVGFAMSLLLFWFSDKIHDKKLLCSFLSAAGIIILILMAAFRADTVGTDVRVYAMQLYEKAIGSSSIRSYLSERWWSSWHYMYVSDYEPGFSFTVYAAAVLTGSFPSVLAAIQAVIVLPVYAAIKEFRPKIPVWLGMAVFELMFFNLGLNIMRQMTACSFCLLAYAYMINEKHKQYLITNIIACLFHKTAVFGFAVYAVYWFIVRSSSKRRKKHYDRGYVLKLGRLRTSIFSTRVIGAVLGCMLLIAMVPLIVIVIRALGKGYYVSQGFSLMPKQIVLRLPLLAVFLISGRRSKEKYLHSFFMTLLIIEMTISQFASFSEQTVRICYFISMIDILCIPYLCTLYKGMHRTVLQGYYLMYLGFYWIYFFVISGSGQTIPYLFR